MFKPDKIKMLKTYKYFLFLFCITLSFSCLAQADQEVWIDLFNGEDLSNWIAKTHHHEVGEDTLQTYRVEEGQIKVRYDRYGDFNDQFSHLYYEKPYAYYRLKVDYQFTGDLQPGAPVFTLLNSGIMFHCQDPHSILKEQNWPIAIELQFLAGTGDGKERQTGNLCTPGTHVTYNGKVETQHVIKSSAKTYNRDAWVTGEILVLGDSLIVHKIDGEEVLRYSKPQIGGEVVKGYDPKVKVDGRPIDKGFIALQSEGQPINFKNIKLLNLEGCMDSEAKNYKSYYVKNAEKACVY